MTTQQENETWLREAANILRGPLSPANLVHCNEPQTACSNIWRVSCGTPAQKVTLWSLSTQNLPHRPDLISNEVGAMPNFGQQLSVDENVTDALEEGNRG